MPQHRRSPHSYQASARRHVSASPAPPREAFWLLTEIGEAIAFRLSPISAGDYHAPPPREASLHSRDGFAGAQMLIVASPVDTFRLRTRTADRSRA